MIPPLTAAERAEITQQSLGRERVSQEDTLRAERYFAGLCVCCGGTPTVAFNPLLPDALTHCLRCACKERDYAEKDARVAMKFRWYDLSTSADKEHDRIKAILEGED